MDTAERTAVVGTSEYDGFISYSHAADDLLAPRLQTGLQRFAKPWWKRRALRIFRDESSLSANPHLWSSITEALDQSGWFVLLLSPDAAESPWVNQEIEYWKEHKDPSRILPVLTDGNFEWTEGDISGTAVPEQLQGTFAEEPRWVDMRFARDETDLDLKDPRFADAVADIASALRGVPKDELASEEVKQHRRTIRTAWGAGTLVLILGITAVLAAIQASQNAQEARQLADAEAEARRAESDARRDAETNAELARSRELASSAINVLDDDPQLSILLALESASQVDVSQVPIESRVALREALYSSHALSRKELAGISPTGVMWAATSTISGLHVIVDGESVLAFDINTWDEVWRYTEPTGDTFAQVRFSLDGSTLALSVVDSESGWLPGGDPDEMPARVVILSSEGDLIRKFSFGDCPSIQAAPYSPDGRLLPIATGVGPECEESGEMWTMRLFDVSSGEELGSFETYPSPSDFAWSDDSRQLLVSSWMGWGTRLVDVGSGEIVTEIPDDAFFGSLSPDGSMIAFGNFFNESVNIFDVEAGHVVNRLAGATDQVVDTAFSADGSQVIGSTRGGGTFVWDVDSGAIQRSIPASPPVITMALDIEGQVLYHTGRDVITTWDLGDTTEGEYHTRRHGRIANANSFDANEIHGAIGHVAPDRFISIFEPSSGQLTDHTFPTATTRGTAVLPDGRVIVMPREDMVIDDEELERWGPVSLWDPASDELEPFWGCGFLSSDFSTCEDTDGIPFALETMHTAPNRMTFALGGGGEYLVFDSDTLELIAQGPFPEDANCLLEFGDQWLAFTSHGCGESGTNATVTIIEIGSGETFISVPGSHQVESSHDGSVVAVHEGSGIVALYDTRSWESLLEVGRGEGRIRGLSFSPDDSRLMTGATDGFLRIWDLATGEEIERIPIDSVSDGYWIDQSRIAIEDRTGLWTVVTLDHGDLLQLAVSRLTRSFTADECSTYRIDPCPTLDEIRGS